MAKHTVALIAGIVALAAASGGSPVGAQPPATPPPATQPPATIASSSGVPPLHFRQRTLPNGLLVLSAEDHKTPTAAINLWYRAGGKDDPDGRSGFAHLFEHLMFKSTKNQPSESFDHLTNDIGGDNNAFTTNDETVFYEIIPANYLQTLIWAEADRMANLNVDEGNFLSERSVVEEELRQRTQASPYGRVSLLVQDHSWQVLPYKREPIGSIANLDAATLTDVQEFHRTYYRPDDAVLVVVGDFDPKQLDTWVDRYFGRIAKPLAEIPRVTTTEPPRTAERDYNEVAPGVPLPMIVMNYLTPNAASADAPVLQVIDVLLSGGDSSRLYQSLVYAQQVASSIGTSADLRAIAGLFEIEVVAAGGKSIAQAEQATRAQIAAFSAAPVSATELEKAKNQLITGALHTRETNAGKAEALGRAATDLGDPELVNTEIDRLQAVTAADVQRVAQTYFTDKNLVVVRYGTAEQLAPAGKGATK